MQKLASSLRVLHVMWSDNSCRHTVVLSPKASSNKLKSFDLSVDRILAILPWTFLTAKKNFISDQESSSSPLNPSASKQANIMREHTATAQQSWRSHAQTTMSEVLQCNFYAANEELKNSFVSILDFILRAHQWINKAICYYAPFQWFLPDW